jgi:hypothetical protein
MGVHKREHHGSVTMRVCDAAGCWAIWQAPADIAHRAQAPGGEI